jgi:nitric oxide reductase NorD protein
VRPQDLLELDWEVGVFKALRGLWRWARPEPTPFDERRVARLVDHERALLPLAQLVSGEPVRLLPARHDGGVRGRDLLVPAWIDLAPDPAANRGLLLLRVVLAAAVRRLVVGQSPPPGELPALRASLRMHAVAVAALREELPRFGPAWDEACALALAVRPDPETLRGRAALLERVRRDALAGGRPWRDDALWVALDRAVATGPESPPVPLWGTWLHSDQDDRTSGAGAPEGQLPDGTEAEAPPVEDVHRVLLDPKAAEEKVVTHTFEKVETADTWEGNALPDDGADELDEHLEALEELDLRELVRGGQDAHSVYKAALDVGAEVPDVGSVAPGEQGIPYDEWDVRARRYRPGWCTVYPSPVPAGRPGWATAALQRHRRLIDRLQRQLEDHRARLRPLDRQLDGEHPDVDALVDRYGDVRAGRSGDGRLYVRHERQRRDTATTVLLDVSLSSDSWLDDRRVLDVARDAVLVLGTVAERLGDRFQVLAFASSTRNRCRVWTVKAWDEPWTSGRARLGALEPQGYTRIGPALRHATDDLARTPAEERLLLLVSDGKPNDFDRYEGRYGMADVRMALREADRRGVTCHALALDVAARAYLPPMFGPGAWHVMPTPDHLPPVLTEVYGRLTGR